MFLGTELYECLAECINEDIWQFYWNYKLCIKH